MTDQNKLAILVGGGPAPGINSVIGAATIRACLSGIPVIGVRDGFQWLMRGELKHARPLDIEAVSRIQQAASGLDERIRELKVQQAALNQLELKFEELTAHLLAAPDEEPAEAMAA